MPRNPKPAPVPAPEAPVSALETAVVEAIEAPVAAEAPPPPPPVEDAPLVVAEEAPPPPPEPTPVERCRPVILQLLQVVPYSDLPDTIEWSERMHGFDEPTVMAVVTELIADGRIRSESAEVPAPELVGELPPEVLDDPMAQARIETPTKTVLRLRRAA